MSSISENKCNLPHELKTRIRVVQLYHNGTSINYLIRKYKVSRASIYRWIHRYDGTKESLRDKPHIPLSLHPNSHREDELAMIKNQIRRNPTYGALEVYTRICETKGYSRSFRSFSKHFRSFKGYHKEFSKKKPKRKNLPYDTPSRIGEKMQLDVKFVPSSCKDPSLPQDKKFYQYTILDEATRERFLYAYDEHSQSNSVDFLLKAISYFGYIPSCIQTDNGAEFTSTYYKHKKITFFTDTCSKLNITHLTIRPATPRHNGKVERSHRNDNNRFYKHLVFSSLDHLNTKMARYLKHSNQTYSFALGLISPLQKRALLSS